MQRAIAAPCFGEDPASFVELATAAEECGFDAFFVWDHVQYSDEVAGPPILDPWALLALIAARTSRIRIGTMVTPVSRRRPWVLARQCITIDRVSNGRLTLGVGLGSPAGGDFARFGDEADARVRAELLDEGLAVWRGLCSGSEFRFAGKHYSIGPTRFRPTPVQHPIPVWVGGVLPARRPLQRAARWNGVVPLVYRDGHLTRPEPDEIEAAARYVLDRRGSDEPYDVVVWSDLLETASDEVDGLHAYAAAGATWLLETALPRDGWQDHLHERIARGPAASPLR